jgi:hypothetical protein
MFTGVESGDVVSTRIGRVGGVDRPDRSDHGRGGWRGDTTIGFGVHRTSVRARKTGTGTGEIKVVGRVRADEVTTLGGEFVVLAPRGADGITGRTGVVDLVADSTDEGGGGRDRGGLTAVVTVTDLARGAGLTGTRGGIIDTVPPTDGVTEGRVVGTVFIAPGAGGLTHTAGGIVGIPNTTIHREGSGGGSHTAILPVRDLARGAVDTLVIDKVLGTETNTHTGVGSGIITLPTGRAFRYTIQVTVMDLTLGAGGGGDTIVMSIR